MSEKTTIKSIKKRIKDNIVVICIISFILFLILWRFFPKIIPWFFGYTGDSMPSWIFDAGNTLFSALAFGAMIITLLLQREDLKLQNQEMQETKNIMAKQLELAGISQVESTLFYMLGQYNNILNCLSAKIPKAINGMPNYTVIKGVDYINYLNDRVIKPNEGYYLDDSERIKLFPYINNLMQIFKYVDETDVLKNDDDVDDEFEKRHKYCSMVTSSLSNNELILIDYYLSIYTGIELNRLCTIYALLENKKNPNESKPNGPKYNIDEARKYFKTDREKRVKK